MHRIHATALVAALLTALVTAGPLAAQPRPGSPPAPGPRGGPGGFKGGPKGPGEMLARLKTALNLDAKQEVAVKKVLDAQQTKREALMKDNSTPPQQKFAKFMQMRQD